MIDLDASCFILVSLLLMTPEVDVYIAEGKLKIIDKVKHSQVPNHSKLL